MKGHGYVLLPSRLVGAVLGDSDVSTSAAWSTGHSAIHGSTSPLEGLYTSMWWVAPLDGEPLREDTFASEPCGSFLALRQVSLLRGVGFILLDGC